MANEKISGMSAAATLTGSELVEVVQSGDNVRTTTQAIADLATGSGVTGTGTTNKVAKWTSSSALGNSSIDDLAAGLLVLKSAAGGQYINLVVDNTDDDIEVQLNLISNNTANAYQANLFISDPNTASTIGLIQELDYINLGFNAGGTDTVSLRMEFGTLYHKINNVDYLEMYTDTVYIGDRSQGAYLNIDSAGKLISIGDALGVNNGNYISVDDAGDLITFNSTDLRVNGTNAFSGTVAVPTSITVVNGIVTACS
ncbi:MAG: hypothetical protein IPN99_13650 [Bacteroidetes bacterium]|nr:hypothetical protein [Bacteroidota bacterium]